MQVLLQYQSRGAALLLESLPPLRHVVLQPLCSFFVAAVLMLICGRCLFERGPLQQQNLSCEARIFVDKQELHMFFCHAVLHEGGLQTAQKSVQAGALLLAYALLWLNKLQGNRAVSNIFDHHLQAHLSAVKVSYAVGLLSGQKLLEE